MPESTFDGLMSMLIRIEWRVQVSETAEHSAWNDLYESRAVARKWASFNGFIVKNGDTTDRLLRRTSLSEWDSEIGVIRPGGANYCNIMTRIIEFCDHGNETYANELLDDIKNCSDPIVFMSKLYEVFCSFVWELIYDRQKCNFYYWLRFAENLRDFISICSHPQEEEYAHNLRLLYSYLMRLKFDNEKPIPEAAKNIIDVVEKTGVMTKRQIRAEVPLDSGIFNRLLTLLVHCNKLEKRGHGEDALYRVVRPWPDEV